MKLMVFTGSRGRVPAAGVPGISCGSKSGAELEAAGGPDGRAGDGDGKLACERR